MIAVLILLVQTFSLLAFERKIIGFCSKFPRVVDFLRRRSIDTHLLMNSILDSYSRSYLKNAIPTFLEKFFSSRTQQACLVGAYLFKMDQFSTQGG